MPSAARKPSAEPAETPIKLTTVDARPEAPGRYRQFALFAAVSTAAFSSIAYELLLASYATFLLGSTVFHFSFALSLMMASMGLGVLLTERLNKHEAPTLLIVEMLLAVTAAVAIPIIYVVYARGFAPQVALLIFVMLMGAALGMEIPLLNRLEPGHRGLTRILFFDAIGGFLGGVAFPLLMLPYLGFFRIAALLAVINAALAFALAFSLRPRLGRGYYAWLVLSGLTLTGAGFALYHAEALRHSLEFRLFQIVP